MNATTYQFLAEDHLRTLHHEARTARPVALARQASRASSSDRSGSTGLRFEIVRRLFARLATG